MYFKLEAEEMGLEEKKGNMYFYLLRKCNTKYKDAFFLNISTEELSLQILVIIYKDFEN